MMLHVGLGNLKHCKTSCQDVSYNNTMLIVSCDDAMITEQVVVATLLPMLVNVSI